MHTETKQRASDEAARGAFAPRSTPTDRKLAIEAEHGVHNHNQERAPKVGLFFQHAAVNLEHGKWQQHTPQLVQDVMQVNVKLLPKDAATSVRVCA